MSQTATKTLTQKESLKLSEALKKKLIEEFTPEQAYKELAKYDSLIMLRVMRNYIDLEKESKKYLDEFGGMTNSLRASIPAKQRLRLDLERRRFPWLKEFKTFMHSRSEDYLHAKKYKYPFDAYSEAEKENLDDILGDKSENVINKTLAVTQRKNELDARLERIKSERATSSPAPAPAPSPAPSPAQPFPVSPKILAKDISLIRRIRGETPKANNTALAGLMKLNTPKMMSIVPYGNQTRRKSRTARNIESEEITKDFNNRLKNELDILFAYDDNNPVVVLNHYSTIGYIILERVDYLIGEALEFASLPAYNMAKNLKISLQQLLFLLNSLLKRIEMDIEQSKLNGRNSILFNREYRTEMDNITKRMMKLFIPLHNTELLLFNVNPHHIIPRVYEIPRAEKKTRKTMRSKTRSR